MNIAKMPFTSLHHFENFNACYGHLKMGIISKRRFHCIQILCLNNRIKAIEITRHRISQTVCVFVLYVSTYWIVVHNVYYQLNEEKLYVATAEWQKQNAASELSLKSVLASSGYSENVANKIWKWYNPPELNEPKKQQHHLIRKLFDFFSFFVFQLNSRLLIY